MTGTYVKVQVLSVILFFCSVISNWFLNDLQNDCVQRLKLRSNMSSKETLYAITIGASSVKF